MQNLAPSHFALEVQRLFSKASLYLALPTAWLSFIAFVALLTYRQHQLLQDGTAQAPLTFTQCFIPLWICSAAVMFVVCSLFVWTFFDPRALVRRHQMETPKTCADLTLFRLTLLLSPLLPILSLAILLPLKLDDVLDESTTYFHVFSPVLAVCAYHFVYFFVGLIWRCHFSMFDQTRLNGEPSAMLFNLCLFALVLAVLPTTVMAAAKLDHINDGLTWLVVAAPMLVLHCVAVHAAGAAALLFRGHGGANVGARRITCLAWLWLVTHALLIVGEVMVCSWADGKWSFNSVAVAAIPAYMLACVFPACVFGSVRLAVAIDPQSQYYSTMLI